MLKYNKEVKNMNTGNFIGIALGMKLVNGKFKPKFGIHGIISVVIMVLFIIAFICTFIYGILNLNFEFIAYSLLGLFGFGYLFLISPYTQSANNYYIEFQSENSLVGFRLYYKGKLVNILHSYDNNGKIAFANNNSKLSCISYADNSKMSNFTKYKIINYFTKWLSDKNLLSSQVTTTLEQL